MTATPKGSFGKGATITKHHSNNTWAAAWCTVLSACDNHESLFDLVWIKNGPVLHCLVYKRWVDISRLRYSHELWVIMVNHGTRLVANHFVLHTFGSFRSFSDLSSKTPHRWSLEMFTDFSSNQQLEQTLDWFWIRKSWLGAEKTRPNTTGHTWYVFKYI